VGADEADGGVADEALEVGDEAQVAGEGVGQEGVPGGCVGVRGLGRSW